MSASPCTPLALVRLLQLSSQVLPVGGYSHSHGLEAAIEQGSVTDERSVLGWILDVLAFSVSTFEVPCLLALQAAWGRGEAALTLELNTECLATRESAELRAASVQMGESLRALLQALPGIPAAMLAQLGAIDEPSLPCVWAAAAVAWRIEPLECVLGYLWAWGENQVLVAMKAVPIGQSAGQRVLLAAGERIAAIVAGLDEAAQRASVGGSTRGAAGASSRGAGALGPRVVPGLGSNFAPALAILSAQHETQYSRLFRS